jgi:hypothetical protein
LSSAKSDINVLILSAPSDPHAAAVAKHLDDLKVTYKIWRGEDLLQSCSLTFELSEERLEGLLSLGDGDTISLSALRSIWFRRPGRARSLAMPEPWVERIMEGEAASAMGGIYRSLPCVMVNHPGRDADCLHKIWQLQAAKQVGLSVPETLVTNNPERAHEFIKACNMNVVYKFISESSNHGFPKTEQTVGVPTLSFRPSDLAHLDQISLGPHLFQRGVDKKFEVRATVIGQKIFAATIDSQASGSQGKTDWRLDYTVPMQPYELPDDVARSSLELLRLLGLNYGAIDFCVDHDGRHVFLECNCAGQFIWLEERAKLPISKELALLLAGVSEPLVPAAR